MLRSKRKRKSRGHDWSIVLESRKVNLLYSKACSVCLQKWRPEFEHQQCPGKFYGSGYETSKWRRAEEVS